MKHVVNKPSVNRMLKACRTIEQTKDELNEIIELCQFSIEHGASGDFMREMQMRELEAHRELRLLS